MMVHRASAVQQVLIGGGAIFQYARRVCVWMLWEATMANDLDALRREAQEEDDFGSDFEGYAEPRSGPERMFGMTAAERMFVSVGCFLVTSLAGFALLLVMDKIALP
ncbi:MAG: hypothetical protein JW910_12850 [Anaerolineae bacterium]|nr:hypothetical protein [Anaerolineae bacterium]